MAARRIDDEEDLIDIHHVHTVRAGIFENLVDAHTENSFFLEKLVRVSGGKNGEAHVREIAGAGDSACFVAVRMGFCGWGAS